MRLIPAVLFALSLTACQQALDGPNGLPKGYMYHGTSFNSAPGPDSPNLGYKYNAAKNEEILARLRGVALDMVKDMEAQFSIDTKAVYLKPADAEEDGFTLSFEHVLREVLVRKGYVLTASPQFALGLDFTAKEIPGTRQTANHHRLNADLPTSDPELQYVQDMEFELILFDSQGLIGKVERVENVPVYGFYHDSFIKLISYPVLGKGIKE